MTTQYRYAIRFASFLVLLLFCSAGCEKEGERLCRYINNTSGYAAASALDPRSLTADMKTAIGEIESAGYIAAQKESTQKQYVASIAAFGVSLLDWWDTENAEHFLLIAAKKGNTLAARNLAYTYVVHGDFSKARQHIPASDEPLLSYVSALEDKNAEKVQAIISKAAGKKLNVTSEEFDWDAEARELLFYLRTAQSVLPQKAVDEITVQIETSFHRCWKLVMRDEQCVRLPPNDFMLNYLADLYLIRLEVSRDADERKNWDAKLNDLRGEASNHPEVSRRIQAVFATLTSR